MEFRCMIYSLTLIAIFICNVQSVEVELDEEQKEVLQKFKMEISFELPHEYMKEDYYLARWLTAKQFDVEEAKKMLKDHIKWRSENKMDEILEEDWSEYQSEYPQFTEGVDKEGRPILSYHFGNWDFRKQALAGNSKKLARWFFWGIEIINGKVRTLRSSGKNVTQWNAILNMENISREKHICGPQCLEIYTEVCSQLDTQYPGTFHKIICVNTPPLFSLIKAVAWPLMNKETQDTIELLGPPFEWKQKVSDLVDKDQLSEEVIPQKYFYSDDTMTRIPSVPNFTF